VVINMLITVFKKPQITVVIIGILY
jgi:hypothetical protein